MDTIGPGLFVGLERRRGGPKVLTVMRVFVKNKTSIWEQLTTYLLLAVALISVFTHPVYSIAALFIELKIRKNQASKFQSEIISFRGESYETELLVYSESDFYLLL